MNDAQFRPQPTCTLGDSAALICLNIQEDQTGRCSPATRRAIERTIKRMQTCLGWARAHGVPVLHVLTAYPNAQGYVCASSLRPIYGLQPRADEPVLLKKGLSFFDSPDLARSDVLDLRNKLFVIGFSLASDCLAAAFDSLRMNKKLVLIEDAIASFDLPPYSAAEAEGVVFALLAQLTPLITSEDLLQSPSQGCAQHAYAFSPT